MTRNVCASHFQETFDEGIPFEECCARCGKLKSNYSVAEKAALMILYSRKSTETLSSL